MIYAYFWVTGARETVLDYSDFFHITVHGDDVQDFDSRWDEVLLSIKEVPTDGMLEKFFKMRIRECDQIKKTYWRSTNKNEPKSLKAELSEVEDQGKEMHGSEDQSPQF